MGTSNLYKGPKGSSLLPADYTGEPDEQTVPTTEGEAPEEYQPGNTRKIHHRPHRPKPNVHSPIKLANITLM